MSAARYLIVNADDFGQSPGVNRGIFAAHERGIVTSASLMVRWPAAVEAAAYGRGHTYFGLGLHVDLGEWRCRDGAWAACYEVVSLDDRLAVAEEMARQIDRFRELTGKEPTHLDSHQHVHQCEPVRSLMRQWADRLRVPLRQFCPRIRYAGDFYGQTEEGIPNHAWIGVEALLGILTTLPPGITELACHPGVAPFPETIYQGERSLEVETLCDPRVRVAIENAGIILRSFQQLAQMQLTC
jgi:predicted glycoside hydrolase/deacetylase ChbG (UPF0249 family)